MTEAVRRRILVADDDAATRKLLQRQLEAAGYEVHAESDGRAALATISTLGGGIVIADWSMPAMDGLELCRTVRELQQMHALSHVYFILLTAHSSKQSIIEGLKAGANDYLTKPYHQGELLARVQVGARVLALQEELLRRNIEVQKINARMAVLADKLRELADTDGLTRLPNRRCLFERLQATWELAEQERFPLSCVVLDIDHFKQVNDTYGHAAGDHVLEAVAGIIRRHAQRPELCGRFGGEEFMLILPGLPASDSAGVAERLRCDIAQHPVPWGDAGIAVTVSCGIAQKGAETSSPDDLVRRADTAAYAAKEHGRNQTWVCDPAGNLSGVGHSGPAGTAALPVPARNPRSRTRSRIRTKPLESGHAHTGDQR